MGMNKYIKHTSLWLARIWGTLVLGIILFFLVAHLFEMNDSRAAAINDTKDLIIFFFFPILTLTGLALAYKWEGLGGFIASLAIIVAMTLNNTLGLEFLLLIFPPGFLYLVYWYYSKKERKMQRRMKLH